MLQLAKLPTHKISLKQDPHPSANAIKTQETTKPNTPRLESLGVDTTSAVGKIRHYADGEVLFWQGEKGYESYKILRGKVRVVLTTNDNGIECKDWKLGKEVAQIPKGDEFGGMSKINPSHKRTATCVAVGNVKLEVVGVHHSQLMAMDNLVVHNLADKKHQQEEDAEDATKQLMETVTYHDSEFICKQGEVGDCFYIITSGTVDVRVDFDDDESKSKEPELWSEGGKWVNSMSTGEIFGERAVLSNNPIRSASCVAKGIVKILKMNVTMDTLVENKELKQLLERRRKQLNKQNKKNGIVTDADFIDSESEQPSDSEEELTPRTDAYDMYESDLMSALDDAIGTSAQRISQRRDQKNRQKEEAYIAKRIHADQTAAGRVDIVTGEMEGSSNAFNGDYNDLVESGILFSDDSDEDEDDLMDGIVAAALKAAKRDLNPNKKKIQKAISKKERKRRKNKKRLDVESTASLTGYKRLIKKASDMPEEKRMGGGWDGMQVEALELLIAAIKKKDISLATNILNALCSQNGTRTDQLNWSVHENNGPLIEINKRDRHGLTATHHAAHTGSITMLSLLVETWKADLSAMDAGYSVWSHALNSVSKGLGCTQQTLDWLKIRGAEEHHTGVVQEYTEEYRDEFEAHKLKKEKAAKKARKAERKRLEEEASGGKHHKHHKHKKDKKHKHKKHKKEHH